MPPVDPRADPHEKREAEKSLQERALEQVRLEQAMSQTPKGALALSGAAVLLLLIAWFSIYLFVFLPRGSVG